MSEIDDVLAESMRRRAAEARLGGGSMADVQQRVLRRRRRVATVACAVLVLPALVGVGVVIGQYSSGDNISAAAEGGATQSTVASSGVPCTASFPAGVTATPCAMSNGLVVSCAVGSGSGTMSVGAPDAAPPGTAPAGTVPAGTVPAGTAPPGSAFVVTPDTGPTNSYAVIDMPRVDCSMPACVSGVMSTSTHSVEVGDGGYSTAADGAIRDATNVPPAVIVAAPAATVMVAPGSVPPDASTNVVGTNVVSTNVVGTNVVGVTVGGPNNCGGPTSWTCTGEITTSSTQPGWRDFTECVPVFTIVDGTTTIESGTIVVSPTASTLEEPAKGAVVTSTIPIP